MSFQSMVQTVLMPNVPEHVAIIMDGNGRWATQQGLSRLQGHYQGAQTAKRIISAAHVMGIRSLTLYGFSKDNWHRPTEEVEGLLQLLGQTLQQYQNELFQKQIRMRVIGNQSRLPLSLQKTLLHLCEVSASHQGMELTLAISYSSRDDMVQAFRQLMTAVQAGGKQIENIDEFSILQALSTRELKEPDFIIRTGGEQRLSDFLLFESAYAELYFTDVLWPDFTEMHFQQALHNFSLRHRRFGRV